MKPEVHTVDSCYRQFYVADEGLDPGAPEEWTDTHVRQRFNSLANIVALVPDGNVTARVLCVAPGDRFNSEAEPEFDVRTEVSIPTGRLGVFGWPREPLVVYSVIPGTYGVRFRGHSLGAVESEEDYYVVEFELV